MKTIAIIGQKGGTGKSTLAKILLVAFEADGLTAIGLDLDPQTSLCSWADLRAADSPAVLPIPHSRLPQTLEAVKAEGVQVCIIDTAGKAGEVGLKAAQAADVVIMPLQPTSDDLVTAEATKAIIDMAKAPASFAVLMRVKAQGTRHIEAAEFLQSFGIETCPATIGERVSYQDAAAAGQTPQETEPGSRAAVECQNVYVFTRQHLNI